MTGNPFKLRMKMPPEAHDAALGENPFYVPPGKQDFPLPPRKSERGSLWIVAAIATAGMMFFNFVSVPIAEALDRGDTWILLMVMGMGVYFAQAAILSLALVFAAVPFWQRLGMHWMLAVALLSAWLLGFQTLNQPGPDWDDIATIFGGLPLLALAAQCPLWIVRLYYQWQIVHEGDLRLAEPQRPLSISDLMIATAVVAFSFGIARVSPEAGESTYWRVWAIVMLIAAAVSMASIAPLLVWALGLRDATLGAKFTGVYTIASSVAAFGLMFIFERMARREVWPLFIFPCMIVSYATALSAALWILRAHGYRLKIGWK